LYSDWDDVARAVDHRKPGVHQQLSKQLDTPLMSPSEHPALFALQYLNGFLCPSQQHGGQGCGEDEACGVGAHRVHQGVGAGDVATHTAECLA